MMSDVRYEIKTPLPVIWLENIDTKNPGWSVRNEQTMTKLILVDPVDDEELKRFVHGLILQTSDNVRSKEKKECYSLILIYIVIDHHFLYWLWQSN
jgi:hypothetical protein